MWWCTKHEAAEKAIPHAAHGRFFRKGRGTVPPELIKETAGAATSSAAASFEDEVAQVVDCDQHDEVALCTRPAARCSSKVGP
eukprot:3680785-Amphidinium_carterae.1